MDPKDIFRAVQTGEINSEDAEARLRQLMGGLSDESLEESLEVRSQESTSEELSLSLQPLDSFHGPEKESNGETEVPPVVQLQEFEHGIVLLTMKDTVHKNTFSDELIVGLNQAFATVQANENYKVVILTGYDTYFATGGTQEGLLAIHEGKAKYSDTNVYKIALDCKLPVIAAMQGHGIGAGWCMGMFCDFIVMSRESIYTTNFMKYGFTPGAGSTLIFPEKFGVSMAQEILFTGTRYSGSELESKGTPFPVLPRNEVVPYAMQLARKLSESPRESLIELKNHMAQPIREKLAATIEKEIKMQDKTFVNQQEVKERIQTAYGQLPNSDGTHKPLKQADMKKSVPSMPHGQEKDSIAVIGMAGQFPKSKTLAEFWDNLAQGRDCISEIPSTRWSIDEYYDTDPKAEGKTYSKWMGVLEDIDRFDPLFFNISPAEAEMMDPQQRLFLESSWKCIEDAGLNPASLSGSRCGVFVGCAASDYGRSMSGQGLNAQVLMGGAPSILSARISYLLNLKGPSLAIDTACSSSLVAIAEACNSLVLETSDLALAGGVMIMAGPGMHVMTSKAGMLSKDGRCFTFDARANGFVPGEGVGVILLKRLSDAIRDKDSIYGVIRGWGMNQDGKTNGITAPSVNSQISLESEVYQRFNINPETISMVEAHGTGTKLGDPIEVEGLTEAFRSYTNKKGYCALGSLKSNMGHMLTAAGVAGIMKVLLAMKHRQLPPTINFESLNEHISLEESPFYINTGLQKWESKPGIPRRASVSAFGFSGTNAHMVIEEYVPVASEVKLNPVDQDNPVLFVLSAKSEQALKSYAADMMEFVKLHESTKLSDLTYTLQVGREAMNWRLAFLTDSRENLIHELEHFVNGNSSDKVLTGQVDDARDDIELFDSDEDTGTLVRTWLQNKRIDKVAKLWTNGATIEWDALYGATKPQRISLPTYPFEREHYWLSETDMGQENINPAMTAQIHPLLHQNTSDLSGQRYDSTFTGREFFLADHRVMGQPTLPGVAYLEMVRAAVEEAAGDVMEGETRVQLRNVVWAQPIVVANKPIRVHTSLYPQDDGAIAFEIYSGVEENAEDIIHSQGIAVLERSGEPQYLDLNVLQAECIHSSLSSSQCYEAFRAMGIDYGPGHRGIETILRGKDFVLAKLSLPSNVSHTQSEFVLHPAVMDSALQATIGLVMDREEHVSEGNLSVPFALQELKIFEKCTSVMWARISRQASEETLNGLSIVHIDLCDETGKICVQLKGLSSRELEKGAGQADFVENVGTLMLEPVWEEEAVLAGENAFKDIRHIVILCEFEGISRKDIAARMDGTRCIVLQSSSNDLDARFEDYTIQIFEELQNIMLDIHKQKTLLQIAVPARNDHQVYSGFFAMLQTAQKENPNVMGQLLELNAKDGPEGIIAKIQENRYGQYGERIRYHGDKRQALKWQEIETLREDAAQPWKDGGTYLITGGLGGLGLIFARDILCNVKNSTVVLVGRSPLSADKQTLLSELEALEGHIEYRQVDVGQKEAVTELIHGIVEQYGGLNGILHTAGVIRDNFIIKKTIEEVREVLTPKVSGLIHLDQASSSLPLDFFILFSSGAGSVGNVGQADYSAANGFMDAYASYRNALAARKQRQGHTLSINWPLWKDGGMHVDGETEKAMQGLGMIAMETENGIKALYQSLSSGKSQVMVIEGYPQTIKTAILGQPSGTEISGRSRMEDGEASIIGEEWLREKAEDYLKTLLSAVIKLPAESINVNAPMDRYGIDSILVMQLTNELEKTFGSLPKTLFFEYHNLRSLTGYFLESHHGRLVDVLKAQEKNAAPHKVANEPAKAAIEPLAPIAASRRRPWPFPTGTQPHLEEKGLDIAIIGISGRYPGAAGIQEFWKNLRDGKDSITEIPKERWDHSLYFNETKGKPGKTYSKWGGFIDGVDWFDPLFFNISPREAETMDPQERLFLECVYETIEDAGYTRETLGADRGLGGMEGNVGVYVGVMYHEYQLYGAQEQAKGNMLGLLGNASAVANRVSYFCNFHGPSIAVDTMCSSSLTAIHMACHGLQHGECELAVAGGVNVSVHPNKYLLLGQGSFASSNGRCESFGQGDGYVPGEGVGALLLKPLAKAIADGDRIYGVIKGTAVNHGGKTNGYTVPNPNAQASVIGQAIQEAGINPRTISYIEAHGTGTPLGDPIEIAGLQKVFREYTRDKQFCSIGSAKSNIGHCESAAGIAAVTKVLLQLKYKQLVPSLHSSKLNPNIDFSDSPFKVQQTLEEWKRPVVSMDGEIKEYPRLAGVSAFGAGGSNAHVVIEEYIPAETGQLQAAPASLHPAMIVLSAKNRERLNEQAQRLLSAIRELNDPRIGLTDIAYTLQIGREAMEERLAIIVTSIQELDWKLESFLLEKEGIEELYRGQVKRNKGVLVTQEIDEDMAKMVGAWVSKGKYGKLAELWVTGLLLDWNRLYGEKKPRRISLPTYPFARESYWVPVNQVKNDGMTTTLGQSAFLSPLLHHNTSNFLKQRFSSTFTGEEFFLRDHTVKGQRILPGVAYLEMVRAAVERSIGDEDNCTTGIRLKNVNWIRPIVVEDQPFPVHTGLFLEDAGKISFEVYSKQAGSDIGHTVHSQGNAVQFNVEQKPVLNLEALQAEFDLHVFEGERCYDIFQKIGMDYGPAFRCVEKVYTRPGKMLAKLALPSVLSDSADSFVLHPSLMDAALHASIGLIMGQDGELPDSTVPNTPSMPFALQEIEIHGACTQNMWSLIQYSEGSKREDKVQKLNIDLCDEEGNVCVRITGLSTRALDGDIRTEHAQGVVAGDHAADPLVGAVMLIPKWDPVALKKDTVYPSSTDRMVIAGGTDKDRQAIRDYYPKAHFLELQAQDSIETVASKVEEYGAVDHILWIAPTISVESVTAESLIEEQEPGVLLFFRMVKALLLLGYGTKKLGWTTITTQAQSIDQDDTVHPAHASLHGLVGTMAKEYPNWKVRIIDLQSDYDWPLSELFTLPSDRQGRMWVFRGGQWYRQQLIPFKQTPGSKGQTLYKTGGVYVVIGGAGNIGVAWSKYMASTYQAQMVWIGRRPKDASIQAKLDEFKGHGPVPYYITADAADERSLQGAYEEIKQRYSKINGVVHSAIAFLEKGLEDLTEEGLRSGLSAKVNVSVRMAQVFQNEPLDFVLFFSSIIAYVKNPGQSSYAAGCTFKDAFAQRLSQEWHCPVKVMNWGYWGNDENNASQDRQQEVENYSKLAQIGVGLIEPQEGMEALETLLASPFNQVGLMKTTKHLDLEGTNPAEAIGLYPHNTDPDLRDIQESMAAVIKSKDQFAEDYAAEDAGSLQEEELEHLLGKLLQEQLWSMGLSGTDRQSVDEFKHKHGLPELYGKWLGESVKILARLNDALTDGNASSPAYREDVWQEWGEHKHTWQKYPQMRARVHLAETTLRALPEIITGQCPATEIMFPNSSMELVEGIYKDSLVADYFNEVLSDTIAAYVQQRIMSNSAAEIRILEIGAGTGGTSNTVFLKLRPYRKHIQEYCYTDISKAFLMHAEKEYGPDNPYLSYRIFNVEEPIAEQGIDAGKYDIVIAANVLHTAKDIRQALRNAKAVLKSNGLLLLNELMGSSVFTHLTFGLLDGWWAYEDSELRIPGCPGLYPHVWKSVLAKEGFHTAFFPAQEAHDWGQQIVAAQSDGLVRQKRQPKQKSLSVENRTVEAGSIKQSAQPKREAVQAESAESDNVLRSKSTAYFKNLLGETLKMEPGSIDSTVALEEYGIDSILVVQITNVLREVIEDFASTLFFEYNTIDDLVAYLLQTQKDSLKKLVGMKETEMSEETSRVEEVPAPQVIDIAPMRFAQEGRFLKPSVSKGEKPQEHSSNIREIAIVGLSGRYPGARNVEEYWNNLKEGKNCITEIPKDRWDWKTYFDEEKGKRGTIYTKSGGFIEGIDLFDPLFFKISPAEAETMDPQERLFLEAAYASIEDAGYTPANLCESRKVGVFAGVMNGNYGLGPQYNSISNRISYHLDFQGPSMTIDTACSSSLTAIHLALESLYSGISECAIVGGVNLIVDPIHYIKLSAMTMLSKTGECKSFGDQADGFVDGEGVGAIVLKPLEKAIADGDHIYGVIKGSMLNASGKTSGYTVPSPQAQSQLIEDALRRSNVDARTISYIEAHGTGTALGDPIEIAGLTRAFEKFTQDKQFCAIGSVKSNIGHTESAAGIAGVTKILLQLKHRQLVPSLHSRNLNPEIHFSNTPFVVQQNLEEWKRPVITTDGITQEYPRRAGISSFGAGGANAHIVIEEYIPEVQEPSGIEPASQGPAMIVLSAKSEEQLKEKGRQLLESLQGQLSSASILDIAYTLQVGREPMEERLAMLVDSITDLEEKLKEFVDGRHSMLNLYRGQVKRNKEALSIFTGDEDLQQLIEHWISKRKYTKLLELWAKGLNLDWEKVYTGKVPHRISLPTYPFAKEHYWTSDSKDQLKAHALLSQNESNVDFDDQLCGRLLDEMMNDAMSVDEAANEIFNIFIRK
ncbi:SDR family NAD(P)-dependent oxidoreductase [Paenibacillus polymyxa]|uniref:SDR family NAD(P)-dependent oxidoreductase n=1 Tax=Paenibacillus polymyxa TaxID=1406 RepID=UPI0005EC1A66|nr:SDR family NAD(P)-dependent oxidoreductase [Paenibacillus polymyxa]KJK30395.1 polyketide synthase [Paenibacillus polymyxa]RPE02773.1 SDR family NAD(P)-dependent oxidoreductase [Paenibacillus polymyxa]